MNFTLLIVRLYITLYRVSSSLWDIKFLANILSFWWAFSDENRAAFSLRLFYLNTLLSMPLDASWLMMSYILVVETGIHPSPAWVPRTVPCNPFGLFPPLSSGLFLTYMCWFAENSWAPLLTSGVCCSSLPCRLPAALASLNSYLQLLHSERPWGLLSSLPAYILDILHG